MGVVAEFTVAADAFALAHTLGTVPEMRVEIERLATHSREWVMPFAWAAGGDFERFEALLTDDPSVVEAEVVERVDGATLYNIRWSDDVLTLVDRIIDRHGTVLEASAQGSSWHLKLRFLEREMLSDFQDHFEEHGPPFELHRLVEPTEPRQAEFGLTPEQREALVAALENGYFKVPRTTSLTELADELGISANSASQRLRRGHAALVENALTVKGDGERAGRG